MAQPSKPVSIILNVKGLYLNPSTFGNIAPNGALSIANNVVIDRPSVVATRRGFDNSFSTITGAGVKSEFQYANVLLLHGTNETMYADPAGDGSFSAYTGTYNVPDPTNAASRIHGIETNKNFYFITQNGTYRLDTPVGTPRLAGAPPGLSGYGSPVGTSGFLPANTSIAYRVVFGYTDFNQQLVLGAPSSRIVVTNAASTVSITGLTGSTQINLTSTAGLVAGQTITQSTFSEIILTVASGYVTVASNTGYVAGDASVGSDTNVSLTFQVPKEIQASATNFIFQVYRSDASPDLATQPSDEMALTYEDVCTATPTITVSDVTPSALLGASLYTNVGQGGILQANYRPPWAADLCTFKQYAFYANCRTLQNATLTLIAAGASNGADALIPGDTVTFTGTEAGTPTFTVTATSGPNDYTTGAFQVSNTTAAW